MRNIITQIVYYKHLQWSRAINQRIYHHHAILNILYLSHQSDSLSRKILLRIGNTLDRHQLGINSKQQSVMRIIQSVPILGAQQYCYKYFSMNLVNAIFDSDSCCVIFSTPLLC